MSSDQASAPNYKGDLIKKKTSLHRQINELEKIVYEADKMDVEWFDNYNKLNHLNIDLMTVKSRLENIGNHSAGIEVMKIDNNQLNNK